MLIFFIKIELISFLILSDYIAPFHSQYLIICFHFFGHNLTTWKQRSMMWP